MAGTTVKRMIKKSPKVAKPKAPVVVETPAVVEEPVVEEPAVVEAPVSNETLFQEKVKTLLAHASSLTKAVKSLESDLKQLQVTYNKEQKQMKKKKKRTRAPSEKKHGFLGHSSISADLADFLGLETDAKISRPDVTRAISKYVKDNSLFTENKSIFTPDEKLLKILGEPAFLISKKNPEKGMGYTYFNLQSYLKKMNHFVKQE